MSDAGRSAGVGPLTAREHELLRHVAGGLTSKVIADRLALSHGSVRNRLTHIYVKLGVSSRTEAALWLVGTRAPCGDDR